MKRVKVITSNAELEEFLARTDIEIINVNVRSCEQSWFAQEYFTAVIYYDDEPKSEYNPDYWTRLEHQYAGMAMQGMLNNSLLTTGLLKAGKSHEDFVDEVTRTALRYAHALVEKLKSSDL
jgi:hypothetical protein